MNPASLKNRLLPALGLLVLSSLTSAAAIPQEEDLIRTTSGKEYRGLVVYENDEILVLRSNSRLKEYQQSKLAGVKALGRELPKALKRLRQLRPGDRGAHLTLADKMIEANLPLEARLLYWHVLSIDQENEIAHQALEHRRVAGHWKAPTGKTWLKIPKLLEARSEWSESWEFETSHFQLRSNMPLRETLLAAFDLEYTHTSFYELFGEPLELHASHKKIEVWLHGDKKSYSDPNQGRGGYYRSSDRRLYVDGTIQGWRNTIVHESMHGILDFAATHTRAGKGNIPAWLHESLAMYMEPHRGDGSYSDNPADIGSSGQVRWCMTIHAAEKKPFALKNLLNMSSADFALSSRKDLRYAQAYSLTYFCLNADKGKYREGFFGFVRDALQGKSSSTDFRKALGMRNKELEEAWSEYVQQFKRKQ